MQSELVMDLDLDDPTAVVLAAVAAFDRAKIDVLVYGGMALAIFGEPRETRDADLAVAGVTPRQSRDCLTTTALISTGERATNSRQRISIDLV